MATHSLEALASLLDDRINILESDVTTYSPAKQVFGTISTILALVRDRIHAYKETVQLSDYCFDVCEALKATIQENTHDLGEFAVTALGDVGSVICEIERTLKTAASLPHVGCDKGEIEGKKLKIQDILDALNRHSSSTPSDGDDSFDGHTPQSLSHDSHNASMTSVSENAFGRLLRREFISSELPSLIEAVLTSKDMDARISCLPSNDAQTIIDVLDEVLKMPDLSLSVRVKCLRRVYRNCGRHGLLPKALKVPICYDRTGYPCYSGGNADVWKGEYDGRDVAVKVIRTYTSGNLKKILGRFCKEAVTWKSLHHPNILSLIGVTMSESHFAMVSDWMVNGSINEFLKGNPDVNRLDLLRDVATGLIYIHQRGMIHGDLKGDNILIDQTGHARLADFGFLTIISDSATHLPSSSYSIGGTLRWMSPELIAPGKFGMERSRPTKSSDCYALGMVVYEAVSGKKPYHETPDVAVFLKIVEGERPRRCEGFLDSLWGMMEECWAFQPNGRPSIEGVLQCLEMCSDSSSSLPGMDGRVGVNLGSNGKDSNETDASACSNCQSTNAPVSRRDPGGRPLCTACDPRSLRPISRTFSEEANMPGVTARKQGIIRAKDARNQPLPSEEYNFTIIPPSRPSSRAFSEETSVPGVTTSKQGMIRAKDAQNRPLPSEEYNFTIIPPSRPSSRAFSEETNIPGVTTSERGVIRAKDVHSRQLPSEEYNFTIIPPSRPSSRAFSEETNTPGDTLRAEDAHNRPLPSIESPRVRASTVPVLSELPAGFVPFAPSPVQIRSPLPANPEPLSPFAGWGFDFKNLPSITVEERPAAPIMPFALPFKSRKADISGSSKYTTPNQYTPQTTGAGSRNKNRRL